MPFSPASHSFLFPLQICPAPLPRAATALHAFPTPPPSCQHNHHHQQLLASSRWALESLVL